MNKHKHTPGPWEVFESHTGPYVIDSAEQAAVCKLEWCLEAKANARLIAAAPELLDALRLVLAHAGALTGADWTAIRAAIAKAEGEG